MRSTYSALLQSKFFNPAFNSAIFDGPVRIYFSQFQEPFALKIYFALQQHLPEYLSQIKTTAVGRGRNVLVLLYPTSESFQMSFDTHDTFIVQDQLEGDNLIGINGPFEDHQVAEVLNAIKESIASWAAEEVTETTSASETLHL
jgi:hypothetical protein